MINLAIGCYNKCQCISLYIKEIHSSELTVAAEKYLGCLCPATVCSCSSQDAQM